FLQEQTLWVKAASAGSPADATPPGYYGPEGFAGSVDRLLMILTADWSAGSIDIEYKLCDARGDVVFQPNTDGFSLSGDTSMAGTEESARANDSTTNPLKLSPLATELQKLLQADGQRGQTSSSGSPELRGLLLDPVGHDPLAIFPSEPLLVAAAETGTNVVAGVDDGSFASGSSLSGSASEVLSQFGAVKDGWLCIRPNDPLHPVLENRKGLAAFLSSIDKEGRMSLEAQAAYAQTSPGFDGLGWTLALAFLPQTEMLIQGEDWQFLKLFGMLSQTDRAVLLEGKPLVLADMPSDEQGAIGEIVYSREAELASQEFQSVVDGTVPAGNGVKMGPELSNTLLTEPTELLPAGVDMRVTLAMTSSDQDAVFASIQVGDQATGLIPSDPDTIAMALMTATQRDLLPDGLSETILGYQTGRRRDYQLTVALPRRCMDTATLTDFDMARGPMIPLEKLPNAMRKHIQARIDEMGKMLREMKSNGGADDRDRGSSVPPP
ncbi:MAG TPA: hypothetical protein VMI31_09705, partial [Fimbriimonadaceae bacterium]|nr:hypothetical protein [Fimbriimonadaceae bacterium]